MSLSVLFAKTFLKILRAVQSANKVFAIPVSNNGKLTNSHALTIVSHWN